MRALKFYTFASLALVSLVVAARQRYDVVTTNGKITGHDAPGMRNTIEFLGIPYAQPPVGQLRFAEPLPPEEKTAYVASDWVWIVSSAE
jgi:cholinesterase